MSNVFQCEEKKNIIVVTSSAKHAENDKLALSYCGMVNVKHYSSGPTALAALAKGDCDLVLCDNLIDEMDARHFIKTIRHNPSMKTVPVIMVSSINERSAVLDMVAAGCSGYILRPYTRDTFMKHVRTAVQLNRYSEIEMRQLEDAKAMLELGHYDDAIEEFQEVVADQGEAQKFYDLGCRYLAGEKWGKAIVAFHKAIKVNHLYAEAFQGLAEAYKGKGDLDHCQFYLQKAANLYAEFDRMEKVKEVFIDILKYDQKAPNPFNTLGVKLRKEGDYEGAIRAYEQALKLTPNDEHVYFNLAKAFTFLKRLDEASDALAMALRMNDQFLEARQMYRKLKGKDWPPGSEAAAAIDGEFLLDEDEDDENGLSKLDL